jgi:2'-5' RNA ligase
MALIVSSYPNISKDDYDWIQRIRAQHDILYYRIVAPHFTLVFPCSIADRQRFMRHIDMRTKGVQKIPFVSRCTVVVKDQLSKYTDVFLVPDEGFSKIVKLHDRLYTGLLSSELRLDIPFVPHIGIGNSPDPMVCKRLADDLNRKGFSIRGTIDTLDIAFSDGKEVKTIRHISLEERHSMRKSSQATFC